MFESAPKAFTHDGKPARMTVMRNDGYCWGRIRFDDGRDQLDVETRRDQYERTDEEALDAFIRASRKPTNISPATAWID